METHFIANKDKMQENSFYLKTMYSVFWHRQDILLVDFLPQGSTINTDVYCKKLLHYVIQNK